MKFTQYLKSAISPFTLALVLGLFLPIICLLWFMLNAIDNDRIIAQTKLEAYYKSETHEAVKLWQSEWQTAIDNAQINIQSLSPQQAFWYLANNSPFTTVALATQDGQILYPNTQPIAPTPLPAHPLLTEAERFEYQFKEFQQAREAYLIIAEGAQNTKLKLAYIARAARCAAKAGDIATALADYQTIIQFAQPNTITPETIDATINALVRAIELQSAAQNNNHSEINTLVKQAEALVNNYELELHSRKRIFYLNSLSTLAEKLNTQVNLPSLNFENTASSLLQDLENEKTDTLYNKSYYRLNSEQTHNHYVLDFSEAQRSLQKHINKKVGADAIKITLSYKNQAQAEDHTIMRFRLNGLFAGLYLDVHWLNQASIQNSISHKSLVNIIVSILVVIFLCSSAVYLFVHIQRQNQLSQLKNDAISTIAHELKTPLTSVRLLLDNLLDKKTSLDEQTLDYINIISREHIRLASLVDNFLTFSRLENNKLGIHKEPLDVNNLIQEALVIIEDKYTRNDVQLTLRLTQCQATIYGDENLLKTVLINLLDNACKYSSPPKCVAVLSEVSKASIIIKVTDNGIGIPPKDQKKVFERYYRADQSLSRVTEGCGLGLHISKKIIDAHMGKIWLDSELGRGSKFVIELPLHKQGAQKYEA